MGYLLMNQPQTIAELLNEGIIDIAQLHGGEDEDYIKPVENSLHGQDRL